MKYSVIIPVYNVEKYLKRCVDSILSQTYEELEVLLVDDGSTDCSGEICDVYAMKDSRVKVFHKENEGLSSARNLGLDIAQGEFIVFVDSDDWIESNMYEYMFTALKSTNSDIVCVGVRFTKDETSVCQPPIIEQVFEKEDILIDYIQSAIKGISCFSVCRYLYRRDLFTNIRFPYGKICEDIFVNFQLLSLNKKMIKSNQILYNYYQRPSSISSSSFKLRDYDLLEAYDNIYTNVASMHIKKISGLSAILKAKGYFSLLAKILFWGINENISDQKYHVNFLLTRLRKSFFVLFFSSMNISRKFLMISMCINFKMTGKVIHFLKDHTLI